MRGTDLYSMQSATYIVGKIVEQIITTHVLRKCFPRSIIYMDCTNKVQLIQQSILDIARKGADQSLPKINDQIQFPNRHASFIVKSKNTGAKTGLNIEQQAGFRKVSKFDKSIRLSSEANQLQIQQPLKGQKPQLKPMRFHPCASSHQVSKKNSKFQPNIIKPSQNELTERDIQDSIKQFRQKLIFKPYYSQNVQKIHSLHKVDSKQLRKVKQNQHKKCIALTTDYDGFWVHLNKNDINKHLPHFIQVQTEVLHQKTEIEPIKNLPKRTTILNQLKSQYGNYKEIKTIENQNNFSIKILSSMKSPCKMQNTDQSQQKQNPVDLEIKLTGKTCQPEKMGFHEFQKIVKNKSRILCNKVIVTEHNKPFEEKELKKTNSFRKKQSFRSNKSGFRQKIPQRNLKKLQSITLGSQMALNYLLKEDFKGYKKKVTIDQNFL